MSNFARFLRVWAIRGQKREHVKWSRRARVRLLNLEERDLPSAAWAFEFGPPGAKVVSGYTGVALQSFNDAAQFGWLNNSGLSAVQRDSAGSLTSTLVAGTNNTFLADLPNGTYDVDATIGDSTQARSGVSVLAQGQMLAANVATQAGQFIHVDGRVTVSNGRLNFQILDKAGSNQSFALDALTVQPASGPDAGNSTVILAAPSVISGTTSTVTIVVKDSAGNGISGLSSSAFVLGLSGGTSAGSFGPVYQTSTPGTYAANFNAVTAGTASAVTVSVRSVSITTQPALTVTPGAVSSARSWVGVATPTVSSGSTDTVSIVVRDAAANPISGLPANAFTVSFSGGSNSGTFGSVTPSSAPGVYLAKFTGNVAGSTGQISISVNGAQIASHPFVTVTNPNATASFATSTVASGATDSVTIVVKNGDGSPVTGLANSAFAFNMSGTSTGTFGPVSATSTPGTYSVTFTGGIAGAASTLTLRINGIQISSQPTVIVTPGAVNGGRSSVMIDSSAVKSGGTATVWILVKDSAGNAVTGLGAGNFVLSLTGGTSTGSFGSVTPTTTPGTYTATLIGNLAGSATNLNATVAGVAINNHPTVTVGAGAVSGTNSTVSFASPSVASGQSETVTIVVKDAQGNAVSGLPASAFVLGVSGGTSTGWFGSAYQTSTSGTYAVGFNGIIAGTASTLSVKVNNVAITAQPSILVTAGAANNAMSWVSAATPSVALGSTDTVTIVVRDAAANPISGLPSNAFVLGFSGGTGTGSFGAVTPTPVAGVYSAAFTGTAAGTAGNLTVSVGGVQLSFSRKILVSSSNSSASFATPTVASGSTDLLTILVKDSAGNPITGLSSSAFNFSFGGGSSTGSFGRVTATSTPGVYTAAFTGNMAGTAGTLTVTVNGMQITSQPTVTVTPGSASGWRSWARFATSTVQSGSTDSVTIMVEDAAGNAVTGLGSNNFSLTLSGGASTGSFSSISPTSTPGSYTGTFTGVVAGTTSNLSVTVNGIQINSHPGVMVTPGAASGANSTVSVASPSVASGKAVAITIAVKDSAGNAVAGLSNSAFVLTLAGGTSTGTFGSVNQTSTPGTYTVNFNGATAGSASALTVMVNNLQINTQPSITVTAGAVSRVKSTVGIAEPTITAGATDLVTIVVKDAAGNSISGLANGAFVLTCSGGGSQVTFSTVSETSTPGTYTTVLTGATAGSASNLTVKINGIQISSSPQVTVSATAVDGTKSSVSLASPTIASGQADTITISVIDASGNPVQGLTRSSFSFALSGGTSSGSFSSTLQSLGQGVYTVNFIGGAVGTASTITVTVNGVQISTKPTVTVAQGGSISGTKSTVSFATPSLASGTTDLVTIKVADAAGNPISGLSNGSFSLALSGGASSGTFGAVTETSTAGTYTSVFTGNVSGTASTLTVTVNGIQITTQPTVVVTNQGATYDGLNIPISDAIWFTPARLAQARQYYATHPFTPASDDAEGNALAYLMTGNVANAQTAINLLMAFTVPANELANGVSDTYRWNGWVPIVFDWCYDQMTPSQVSTFVSRYNGYAQTLMNSSWGGPGMPANNYFWGYWQNEFDWGVATYYINTQMAQQFLDDALKTRWNSFTAWADGPGAGGVLQEGSQYGRYMLEYTLVPFESAEAMGLDLIGETNFYKEAAYNLIYTTSPMAVSGALSSTPYYQVFPFNDDEDSYGSPNANYGDYVDFMAMMADQYAGTPMAGEIRQWLTNVGTTNEYWLLTAGDSGGQTDPLSSLPTDYYAPGDGFLYAKNSWQSDATSILFQLGSPSGVGHMHMDSGSFQMLSSGQWLTKDSTGYADQLTGYGGVGTVDTSSALATNSLLVAGKGETVDASGAPVVTRLESTPDYTFASVDLTQSYTSPNPNYTNPNVVSVVRDFLYVKALNVLLVFDRVQTQDGGTISANNAQAGFLLHFVNSPTINGNTVTGTNGNQQLTLTTLVPTEQSNPILRVVNEHTAGQASDTDAQYRLEEVSSGQSQTYMINVLQASAVGAAKVTASMTENSTGFTITLTSPTQGTAVVQMNKGMTSTGGSFGYSTTGTPTQNPLTGSVESISVSTNGPSWG